MLARFLFGLAFSLLFLPPSEVLAMRLEPDSSDLFVIPGELSTAKIFIQNDQKEEISYRVRFVEASFGEDANDLRFSVLSAEKTSRLKALPENFTLEPGQKQEILIEVRASEGESGSESIAVIVEELHEGEGIALTSAAASLLFLHIGEGLVAQMNVLEWQADPLWTTRPRTNLSLVVRNDGNDTRVFDAEVMVENMFGREVARFPISEREKRVPDGKIRSFSLVWPPEGEFQRFLFGQHTFSLVQGENVLTTTATAFFPLHLLLAILLIALLVLGILMKVRRVR